MTEFVVAMENRPGRLAALTEALADAGVNIEALTAHGYDGEASVRLIVSDSTAAARVLAEAGLQYEERTVLTVHLPHRPGELAKLTRSLANASVNIDAIYVLKTNADGVELALSVDQPATALPHLQVLG